MARTKTFSSGVGIGIVATTFARSQRVRGMVRKGTASAASRAVTVARIVARGTRNLQEEQKHVTRFGMAAPHEGEGPAGDEHAHGAIGHEKT